MGQAGVFRLEFSVFSKLRAEAVGEELTTEDTEDTEGESNFASGFL